MGANFLPAGDTTGNDENGQLPGGSAAVIGLS
jgi:hypothetical protein